MLFLFTNVMQNNNYENMSGLMFIWYITPPLRLHLLLCLHSIGQPNRPWHWLSDQNSVEQESSTFVVSWSILEAFVTHSVGLDRTVYIGAV